MMTSPAPRLVPLIDGLREYIDTLGGGIDRHDAESILDDPDALNATVDEFINGWPSATADDAADLITYLVSHGWPR